MYLVPTLIILVFSVYHFVFHILYGQVHIMYIVKVKIIPALPKNISWKFSLSPFKNWNMLQEEIMEMLMLILKKKWLQRLVRALKHDNLSIICVTVMYFNIRNNYYKNKKKIKILCWGNYIRIRPAIAYVYTHTKILC